MFCISNLKSFQWIQRWRNKTFFCVCFLFIRYFVILSSSPRLFLDLKYLYKLNLPYSRTKFIKSSILKNKVHSANLNLSKAKCSIFALYRRNSECVNAYTRLKIMKFYVFTAKNGYVHNEGPKYKVTNTVMPNTLLQLGCIHDNWWQMLHIRLLLRHQIVSLIGTNNVM